MNQACLEILVIPDREFFFIIIINYYFFIYIKRISVKATNTKKDFAGKKMWVQHIKINLGGKAQLVFKQSPVPYCLGCS